MACTTSDYAVGAVDAELDHGVFPDNSSPSEDGDSFCGGEVAADMSTVGSYLDVVPSSTGSGSGAATPERAFPRLHLLPMTAAEELGLPLGADAASSGDAVVRRGLVRAAAMEVDEVRILA